MSDGVLTEKARKDWNDFAETYQANSQEPDTHNKIVEIPAMLSLIGDVKDKKVLDAGCGHGYYSLLLAKKGAIVTGIDISEKMIELAKKDAVKASVQCQFFVCDMQDLSMFKSDNFDLVTSSFVAHYLDDIRKAFSEVFRVLKLQGIFTFSAMHPITKGQWEKDSQDRRLHWNVDNYFDRSILVAQWRTKDGRIIELSFKHRTVQDYFDALTSAGFVVERLVEPEPIGNGKVLNVSIYERTKRIPYYILLKARKPI